MDLAAAMSELRTSPGVQASELDRLKEGILKLATEPPEAEEPLPVVKCLMHGPMKWRPGPR